MSQGEESTEAGTLPKADAYEALKLNAIVRNGSALAALVLAYSMNWMNLMGVGHDISRVRSTGLSVSAPAGGRQSIVLKPGDMEVFGVPLTMAFVGLFVAAVLRVAYPRARRLHPIVPLVLAAPGTIMLCTVLGQTIHDETIGLLTSGFYIALAAFVLNTLFDVVEVMDWRALRRGDGDSASPV